MITPGRYVRYSDDLEQPLPDEDDLIGQVADAMRRASQQVAGKHRHGRTPGRASTPATGWSPTRPSATACLST